MMITYEIDAGLEAGLDASSYAKPRFHYNRMRHIRRKLALKRNNNETN